MGTGQYLQCYLTLQRGKSMKTWILDFKGNNRESSLAHCIFCSNGYDMHRVKEGSERIDLAVTTPRDFILPGIQLPVLGRYPTTCDLRPDPGYATTPIVAFNSCVRADETEYVREAGCRGDIEKPINTKSVTEQFEQYLLPITPREHTT